MSRTVITWNQFANKRAAARALAFFSAHKWQMNQGPKEFADLGAQLIAEQDALTAAREEIADLRDQLRLAAEAVKSTLERSAAEAAEMRTRYFIRKDGAFLKVASSEDLPHVNEAIAAAFARPTVPDSYGR